MEHRYLWIAFGMIVLAILAFDLGVMGRRKKTISLRESLLMVGCYALLAVGFGISVLLRMGHVAGMEFFSAYLLEQSLSLDNIFVWVLIFQHFEIPEDSQHNVLFWGILGAMVLRGVFIFVGTALINAFDWLLYGFGVLVIVSGLRLLFGSGSSQQELRSSPVLRFVQRYLPVTNTTSGTCFFVCEGRTRRATPLLLALIVIESTDLIFALDSIPAIFGITRDPFIVYTSNVFAILGLRALYFAVAHLVSRLHYLRYGLALLLVLIGVKMLTSHLVELPIWLTLAATFAVLAGTIGLSLARRSHTQT